MSDRHKPVFIDYTGRRWRRIRFAALVLGVATTLVALVLVASELFNPPIPPELPLASLDARAAAKLNPKHPLTEIDRLRIAYRRKLATTMKKYGSPHASRRPELVPVLDVGRGSHPTRTDAIVAGFYVNWADNSFVSLKRNYDKLDWVIGEWAFVPSNADTLLLRVKPQVIELLHDRPAETRPSLFIMLSNFVVTGSDSAAGKFDAATVRRFLGNPVARANAIRQLRTAVIRYGLAGTTLDMENFDASLQSQVLGFARELHDAMHSIGRLSTQAVAVSDDDAYIRRAAAENDKIFPMLFDEHYGSGDPGPVSSQRFYVTQAERFARLVDPSKLILMVGAYGYDWNDAEAVVRHQAEAYDFQEVMRAARGPSRPHSAMDPVSMNPYMQWTDPDSTDHVLWYLDATTAYNQMKVGHALGVAGHAIWHLGGEDPSIWNAIGLDGSLLSPDSLRNMPSGYDAEQNGTGEILQIQYSPKPGYRNLTVDDKGYITGSSIVQVPIPYVVTHTGGQDRNKHRVALTFDDGPDGRWTPMILDTLRSRGAKATFFVVGQNVDVDQRLLERMYNEGHEIGNHTYRHPNLALASRARSVLEIDMTTQLVSSVLNRRMAFFRPPYFGDAEPTTSDELVPVGYASDRHYWTIGLHVDSEDWRESNPDSIIANVLREREHPRVSEATRQDSTRSIILMHDSGGDRSATVAALGPLIDSLRARGDTLVLVSDLAGISRDEAMPPLPPTTEATRFFVRAGFLALGIGETLMFWVFSIAVALGIGRLAVIGLLALIERLRDHKKRGGVPGDYAPGVSIIVPAYNEEKVIVQTIASLLNQKYAGPIEIVVVDDGSSDETIDIVREAYGSHPSVSAYRKENGGKASALNYGIERAQHEIVIGLDADTIFDDDTVSELVQPLEDPDVGAVAGNAKVGNRINLVTRWQALEYVTSQNLDRRAFSLLDCITVVPGAVGAWRRSVVQQVGGFKEDTLAEDQDLTLAIRRTGLSVAYADSAVAYTEAPDTLRGLAKQRFRWSFGTLQCTWKHRDAFLRPKYGSLGFVGLPNVFLFQLLLPAISPVADLMFLWSIASVWFNARVHTVDGRLAYALPNLEQVLSYYAVFLLVDWLAAVIAFLMEGDEDKSLTWSIFVQRFAYRQVMYWVVVRSFAAALSGRLQGWGKLERKATVSLPERRRRLWARFGELVLRRRRLT
jgi:cellulose synthase/poly-beta-1,6-N-acetylglucosamine synthase-like glycosyltransferase/peptidoglycan/xylan/chitin deacetylase (PgdA/CDA1 family)/spore germination protein YaaH